VKDGVDIQFIESICIRDGKVQLLSYHQKRVNRTLKKFYPDAKIDLAAHIDTSVCDPKITYKCRIIYDNKIKVVEIQTYQKRVFNKLKLIHNFSDNYTYKTLLRPELDQAFSQKANADEIILIDQKGSLLDAYYFNVILEKKGLFYAPSTYLLNGVMRQYLIKTGRVKVKDISIQDLSEYDAVYLVNAMNLLGEIKVEIGLISNY
jgi:4-amino-4-deoxychorismate lyase